MHTKSYSLLSVFRILFGALFIYFCMFQLTFQLPLLQHESPFSSNLHASMPAGSVELWNRSRELNSQLAGSDAVHELGVIIFFFAFMFDLFTGVIGYWAYPARRNMALLLCAINLTACVSYTISRLGLLPVLEDFMGQPLTPIRYVQWSCSSSMLIYMIASIGKATDAQCLQALLMEFLCIITGFLGSYLAWPWWPIFSALSFLTYFSAVDTMVTSIGNAIAESTHPEITSMLKNLRACALLAWILFPLVWTVGRASLISPVVEIGLMTLTDMVAKCGVSLNLFICQFVGIERQELVELLARENLISDSELSVRDRELALKLRTEIDRMYLQLERAKQQ